MPWLVGISDTDVPGAGWRLLYIPDSGSGVATALATTVAIATGGSTITDGGAGKPLSIDTTAALSINADNATLDSSGNLAVNGTFKAAGTNFTVDASGDFVAAGNSSIGSTGAGEVLTIAADVVYFQGSTAVQFKGQNVDVLQESESGGALSAQRLIVNGGISPQPGMQHKRTAVANNFAVTPTKSVTITWTQTTADTDYTVTTTVASSLGNNLVATVTATSTTTVAVTVAVIGTAISGSDSVTVHAMMMHDAS